MRRAGFVVLSASLAMGQAAPFSDRYATVNGLRLHYLEWGAERGGSQPPMILLHGIARHAHTFDHIAPMLARDRRVIALDMRGHGDSAWSATGDYLVEDHVKDLDSLIDQLGLTRVVLLGNSTGGRVVQVYAGLHPNRVDRLIVEDVGPERPQDIADSFARRVRQEDKGWASEDELVRELVSQNPRTPEAQLKTYARFGTRRRGDGRLEWKRDPNLVKGFVSTELWSAVSRITSPTLYVLGGASRIVPADTQQRLARTLPDCRIVVMPGLGHYPSEEDTPGFLKIVDEFLK